VGIVISQHFIVDFHPLEKVVDNRTRWSGAAAGNDTLFVLLGLVPPKNNPYLVLDAFACPICKEPRGIDFWPLQYFMAIPYPNMSIYGLAGTPGIGLAEFISLSDVLPSHACNSCSSGSKAAGSGKAKAVR
jgi:hypothetical protein